MGRPPAVIIVVRHGARLDAADKQWHLTSPTPYDPPLTYGGWTQSRALGVRIANILRSRETDDEVPADEGESLREGDRRKRRHKVIIHTSPFLRCVQTSVAISAGLAQNPGHTLSRTSSSLAIKAIHRSPMIPPMSPAESPRLGSPRLGSLPEPATSSRINGKPHEQPENIRKSTIRVDAFLGEWLSPDYFEQITPPPSSIMMVAGAKADLLRREDYSNLIHTREISPTANQPFPGGWGSPVVLAAKDRDDGTLSDLSTLGTALPIRERTSSLSSAGSHGGRLSHKSSAANIQAPGPGEHGIYQTPVPTYAISSGHPIPPGYVAHARDACVNVDYQWDSMREPQNWGNGGEYGEEWSSMHKRFRKGIQQLVDWYRKSDEPDTLLTKTISNDRLVPTVPAVESNSSEDDDTDLVVILVTHGAGCNALIGALTNQPVLLDVGMASLTMAVRKPSPVNTPTISPTATPKTHSRASSRNLTISEQYDVKLVANTEHLRTSASSTPSSSRTPSLAGFSTFKERYNGGAVDGPGFGKPRQLPLSGNFGSIRRTASVAGPAPRNFGQPRQHSVGLWSAPRAEEEETADEEPEDNMILNFGDTETGDSKEEDKDASAAIEDETDDDEHPDEIAPLGLWGTPRPPGLAEKIREIGPKRRWTVNERG